jgi:hypothetical protein
MPSVPINFEAKNTRFTFSGNSETPVELLSEAKNILNRKI